MLHAQPLGKQRLYQGRGRLCWQHFAAWRRLQEAWSAMDKPRFCGAIVGPMQDHCGEEARMHGTVCSDLNATSAAAYETNIFLFRFRFLLLFSRLACWLAGWLAGWLAHSFCDKICETH